VDLPDTTTKRLLIVDDNDTNRRIVTLVTQGWGFQTRDTSSPLEALRWLEERRASAKLHRVTITSLTRREGLGDRREFDAFVTKPHPWSPDDNTDRLS
jgi:CheY-like chemotaxis protein